MNYTLHQLEVFLKVTQAQSITKASEQLFLTQPAVSIQLKNFQDQFDIPLTEVIGRKLYVTDFGKEIAIAAEKILNEVYAINYKAEAHKGQLAGRLKISCVSTGKYIIPFFLTGFLKKHPAVELVLDITNKAEVITSIESNEVDFSLVSIIPEHLSCEKIDLMPNRIYLVSNTEIKYSKKMYDHAIFETLPLIYREKGSGTRVVMENYIQKNHLPVRKMVELTSNEGVKQAVLAGLGASIMPVIGIKNELKMGQLQIIPVKGFPILTTWSLIWLKNRKFSPVANAFVDYVRTEKNSIIKKNF